MSLYKITSQKLYQRKYAKNTSQECSECGCISKNSRKSQSKFKCVCCGLEMNADEQASKTILKRGGAHLSNVNVVH